MPERLRTGNFHWPPQAKLPVLYSRRQGASDTPQCIYYSAASALIAAHSLPLALTAAHLPITLYYSAITVYSTYYSALITVNLLFIALIAIYLL